MILQEVFAPVNEVKPLSKDQMDAMDKAREQDDSVKPELQKPEPGFFDGMGEASWKGVASGALKSASALDTALSSTGMVRAALNNAQVETGYMFDDIEGRAQHVENLLDKDSKALRKRARDEFGIDPTTMGTAAQIVYGVAETIPKAIGYSVLAGPAGGSVLFGADLGISRTQELMDEGVDKDTAINAGMVTFGTAALGMRLPATFGRSRIASATIGAAANAGLTAAEMQGVNWVLQNQNYDELAQKYQLNGIDLATSAIFGGVMGGVLWRPGMNNGRPQTAQVRSVALRERIKRQLREASPEHLTDEQIDYQARVHATGIQVMADRAQIDTDAIAPEIVRGESTDGLNQIIGERGASALDSADETTIRLDNRDVAESMEGDGKTPEQIRLATGWERGADGQWRYEIPDIQIKEGAFRVIYDADAARDAEQAALWERTDLSENEYVDQDIAIANKYENQTLTTKLDEVVDAPELFRAYPQLKDLTVEFGQLPRMVGAYYDAAAKVIRLDRRSDILQRNTRSNLAHEIQHAIQDIEGFARGSNLEENSFANALRADLEPLYVMMQDSEAWKIYQEMEDQASELMDDALMARADEYADNPEIQAIFREQQRLRDKYGINHDVLEAIADYHPTNDRIWQTIHENHLDYARQRYSRSAGEVEARNVQDRLDMTNEQRRQSTLESTESYPRNEQIVRYGDNLYRDSSVSIDEQIGNIERIADWLSDDNLNWAKGKSYQEIIAHFGNEPQPVAFIPKEWLTKLFGEEIADNRVYSGKAYFIDHAVNHHPEDIDLEAYVLMQEMISKNTEAIIDDRKGKKGVIFVKQYDKNYLLAVELRQEDDGKIHLYKSLSKTRSKKPYPNLRRARLPVDALNSLRDEPSQYIRTSEEAHGGRRFSALDNSTDIVGQNANDVNEFVPDSELIQRAKDTFGITNDVREAFYVLPDGTMLDGSGRHWGGSEIDVAGQRQVDHGDIAEIIDDSTNPADAMYKWMARSGAMRFDQIVGIASIARKPTPQQLAVLSRASRGKYLALSLNTPEGRIVDDIEFENASPSAIRHFFEDAQIKAENGVAGAFAQRAWHGSPHIFDTFSTEHIGTGEGAQAHGWGLYFAADRGVAERYKKVLTDRSASINSILDELASSEIDVFSRYIDLDDYETFSREIERGAFSPKTNELLRALEENDWLGYDSPVRAIRQALSPSLSNYEHTTRLDRAVEAFDGEGRVFEVEIPDENEMLDENLLWGAGHNFELKQKIKDMIRDWNITNPDNPIYKYPDNPTGKDIYKAVAEVVGGSKAASLWFNERGIKGITYDGLRDGRCYVVFDDKAIQTIDFYQRQNSQTTAEQKLQKDVVAWNKLIDELEAVPKQTVLMLNQTPLVMHLVGADFKKLYATPHMFERLFKSKDGSKGSFGKNELKQIPQALTDPIAIFDQDNGRKLFLLDLRTSNGSPVVVPVEFNARKDFATVNLALTAFAKEKNGKPKFGWIKNLKGKELYVNTKKLTSLNTSAGADSLGVLSERSIKDGADNSSVTKNVLTEDDLVKEREKYPGMYQGVRGSFNPALNRITLTANANISTYSHEMGHWYLENLFQLSRRAAAESTLKEDADTLLREFGINSIEDWDNLGIDGQRKFHEQFASWMEIYLSEGRAPKPTLQRVFERLGQWLVDLYRELGGVKKAVGDTYKAEVGEELPPVSEEVAKVLDRLFANDRAVRKASQVTKSQVAAARMVQANRTNNNKLEEIVAMPNGKDKTRALRDLEKSTKAQLKAIQAMKRGLPVDVSQDVEQMNVDVDHLVEMKGNFGRAYIMGNTDSAVVLQNRDRSDVGSIGQMNAIAANPQFGLVSVSRSYSGAPVVSYGSVPDSAHLGNNDFIVETNGNRVPFMYAVVEAGDVETSNFIDGSTNTGYGNPQRMNAVVGNGRMTALKEAYNRGTANQYRTDLEADTAHGIQPEVIQKMKNPVLVRVINPEDVTTGFISRSNGQQVLALDDVEVAREDAPKIRARAGQYEFDEAGNPTNDTLALFIQDLHDPNALGRLITSDGRPTPEAVRRIRNAVFFEAYQSPELSALFSQEVDPGIRRILNGLANVAPRIIELREQAQELDFSNLLVEAANRIRQARLNPDEGVDFASQMSFLDNPATSAFVEFLDDNANSAVAIARTLNPLIDWAENAAQAADGGLFGGDAEVHVDLADVVGQLRNIINDQRAGAGLEPLPEIDVNALRDQIQTTVDTVAQAVDEVNARIEAETQQAEMDIANEAQALDAQRQQSLAVLDEKSSVDARAQFLMEQNPDQIFRVLDENGMEVQGTLNDLLTQADDEVRQAQVEAAGMGRAVECILRNGGI